jgi:HD-GYP domain-containing protein (c-di-GMP phosphodiesterase class II)
VFATNGKIKSVLPTAGGFEVPADDVWDVLTRFAKEVPNYSQLADQARLTLEAVRDCIRADLVYWYVGGVDPLIPSVGAVNIPLAGCRMLAEKMLEEAPGIENHLLRSALPLPADRTQPAPRSAALVQISRSNRIWVMALSFDPHRQFRVTDVKVMGLVRQIFLNHLKHSRLHSRMSETLFWLVQCLTATIDARVPCSGAHSERVAQIAVRLGQHMRLPPSVISDSYFAGLLHDIGKTGVSEGLLLKPGQLSPEELARVQQYPVIGDGMLAGIKQLAHLRPAVRNHRERFDGRGYPDRLAGEAIPVMARILAVADACDAMLSPRPYRPSLPPSQVSAALAEGAGTAWDPAVVEQFMACRADLFSLCASGTREAVSPAVNQVLAPWGAVSSQTLAVGQATEDRG